MNKIDFLKLTTDICYIIEGYFSGKLPEGEQYAFIDDLGQTVWLDMDKKMILYPNEISKKESMALRQVAQEHKLALGIYDTEEE